VDGYRNEEGEPAQHNDNGIMYSHFWAKGAFRNHNQRIRIGQKTVPSDCILTGLSFQSKTKSYMRSKGLPRISKKRNKKKNI
jgi:hypothetical protein